MADNPTAPASVVSGWQTDTVFMKFTRHLWWVLAADDAIGYVELPILVSP